MVINSCNNKIKLEKIVINITPYIIQLFFAFSGEIKWTEIDIRQKRATFPDKRAEKGMENEMPLMFSLKYGIMRRMSMKLKE